MSDYDYYKNKNDFLSTLIKIYSIRSRERERERERERGGVCDTGKAFVPSNSSFASVKNFIQIYIFDSNVHKLVY